MLKAGGAALLAPFAGLLDATDHERVAAVVSGHSRADMASVEHFQALLSHFRKLDDLMGPRSVHGAVQSTIGVLDGLRDAAEPRIRPALLSVCAQYEQLDAWMWLDRGQAASAERRYDRALARATESGNQPFAGYLLAFKANQTLKNENPRTTIALASQVRSGKWGLTPKVEAYAAQLEARAWAISGDGDRCERNLDDVARLLATVSQRKEDEPPWIYFYGPERLPVHRGFCYAQLGRTEAAISVFDEAIANLPREYARDRASYLFWSAKAYADNDDPKQAAIVARDAVQTLVDAGSDSILDEAHKLHAHLADAQSLPEVREFGELLQTASGQAST